MDKTIVAVDSLAIQRSLTLLEDRYRELREIGQKRFEAWEAEINDLKQQLDAQSQTLQQTQLTASQHAERVQALEADLSSLQAERDTLATDCSAAHKLAADLQQQLDAQSQDLKQNQEELELTLLQLHQVQEELENYFLQNQDLKHKSNKESSFLRSKIEERDSIIKQHQESLERLKGIALQSLRQRPFYARWIGSVRKMGLLPGSKSPLLLPQGK